MSNPLNPDALETASRAVHPGYWELIDKYPESTEAKRSKSRLIEEARSTVSAYLTVTQPVVSTVEVTTVEELDALPVGTVILDSSGETLFRADHILEEWITRHGEPCSMQQQANYLPATVLYRPEVSDA